MPIKPDECTQEEWDAARRMADAVNLQVAVVTAEGAGRTTPGYIAISLDTGASPDGTLYDTRRDAVRHQSDPWNFYVKIGRTSMSVREALICLMYARQARKRHVVFAEEEVIVPQRLELAAPFIPRTVRGVLNSDYRQQ